MAIKLGSNPKSFKKDIVLVTVDGTSEILNITYIYRTRREFGQLIDERIAMQDMAEKTAPARDPDAPADTIVEAYLAATKASAETVLQIATGWDLSDAFTVENLQALEDQFPGTLNEIQVMYQKALIEHRTKN